MIRIGLAGIAFIAAGCGGGGTGPDADPNAPDADPEGACADHELVARFHATAEPMFTGMYGSQAGGVVNSGPGAELAGTVAEAGGCRFVAAQPALCTPACTNGDVCDVHGACVAYASPVAAGTVRITGTTPPLVFEPQAGNSYYAMMGYPGLYAAGDALALDIEGAGDVGPIHVETVGVPVIALASGQLTAREHDDLALGWTPVTIPGAEIVLRLNNDHHAGVEHVECIAPAAAGALTVPSAILDRLILAGESGIGTYIESAWVEQRRRGSVRTSRGCAVFDSESDVFVTVETIRAP